MVKDSENLKKCVYDLTNFESRVMKKSKNGIKTKIHKYNSGEFVSILQ